MTTLLRGKRLKPRTSEVAEALLLHTMTNEPIMWRLFIRSWQVTTHRCDKHHLDIRSSLVILIAPLVSTSERDVAIFLGAKVKGKKLISHKPNYLIPRCSKYKGLGTYGGSSCAYPLPIVKRETRFWTTKRVRIQKPETRTNTRQKWLASLYMFLTLVH